MGGQPGTFAQRPAWFFRLAGTHRPPPGTGTGVRSALAGLTPPCRSEPARDGGLSFNI
ncbi:hypothetical protein EMIT0P74_10501 [Pseudomonas sp. IT-P74]